MNEKKEMAAADDAKDTTTEKNGVTVRHWIDTDKKFVKFLLSDIFTSGLHVWWLIGLFSIITVAFILLVFFASLMDSMSLPYHVVPLDRLKSREKRPLHQDAGHTLTARDNTTTAHHRLGNPYLTKTTVPAKSRYGINAFSSHY